MGFKWRAPRCENPACPNRGRGWRSLFSRPQGIRLDERWHCSLECFEQAAGEMFASLLRTATRRKRKSHRVPLGLLLLTLGSIKDDKLKAALKAQRESGHGRVGDWLRQLGTVTEQQITAALGVQWSCPTFPLEGHRQFLECAGLVPLPVLESSRMVPVHYLPASRFLYMAFANGIDHTALYAVERMLQCRTEPCLADQSSLERALEEVRRQTRPAEILFDQLHDPGEMAHTARNHAAKLGAAEARLVGCGEYLWMRLEGFSQTSNLLFHVLPDGN